MNMLDVNEVAFNFILFKQFGYYQIFSPHSPKIFNCNAYRLGSVVIILTTLCGSTPYGWIGFFVKMDDTIEDSKLLQILFIYMNYYLSVFKICMCIHNADEIWDLLDVTRINFMTSKLCNKYIATLYKYRDSSIKITNFFSVFITATLITWLMFPILVNFVFNSKSDDEVKKRFENVNNFRYPLSIETYSRYFYLLYFIEALSGVVVEYGILIIDILLISVSYVFIAQYEIHKKAFANIGHEQNHHIVNENDCNNYYEDFKSVVIDQQKLNLKLKTYYLIVWPIILATVAVTSSSIILLAYSFVTIFMTAKYIPILNIIKLGSAFLYLCIELFIHCYLFEIIQIKKDTVAFGIYSSNWTAMNMKFKKFVLSTMCMNDGNKLMMNFTQKKAANLEFFSYVMVTCYNTVSVLLRTRMHLNDVSD